jgi:hypothetical protein
MLNHLRLKHEQEIEGTPEKQPSMKDFVQSPWSRHGNRAQNEDITRAIVKLVVEDYMPLRIVEGQGFRNLMSLLVPEYSVPSRNTIKAGIDHIYEDQKAKLIANSNKTDTVALATDTWTSNCMNNGHCQYVR